MHSYGKFFRLVCALAIAGLAPLQMFAEDAAKSDSPKDDRSYLDDFKGKNPRLMMESAGDKRTNVELRSITDGEMLFVDDHNGEFRVTSDSTAFKFVLRHKNLARGRNAFMAGNWENAVFYLRDAVYPALPMMGLSPQVFVNGHEVAEMFMRSLVNADRFVEAVSFVNALPLDNLPVDTLDATLYVCSALVKANRLEDAKSVLDKCKITDKYFSLMPKMIELLSQIRIAGDTKYALGWFTKFANMPNNPQANLCKIWEIYCDLALGNTASAAIVKETVGKLERKDPAFSLLAMINGIMKQSANPKKPDYYGALEFFSEGVVFGDQSAPWVPELLFNTGMAYKGMKNFYASNAIFTQLNIMFPDSAFSKKGLKEIVIIEEKADGDDSEEDYYEDEEDSEE